MPTYAQIQNGRVIAISDGPSTMVLLDTNDTRLLGTTYNGPAPAAAVASDFAGYKATVTADKSEIAADGVETVTISIAIQDWKGEPAEDFDGTITITINGSRKDLPVTDGAASYVYKTAAIGSKTISTQDAVGFTYISHGVVVVEAYGELEEL